MASKLPDLSELAGDWTRHLVVSQALDRLFAKCEKPEIAVIKKRKGRAA